jgi:alanine dehydrogenase
MLVGILKEIKAEENRVCMTPAGVEVMIANGHSVLVEKDAGNGSGFDDAMYINAGAEMVDTPKEIFGRSDMVMHVKEPLPSEYEMIREGQIVFTYLHLAAAEELTHALIKSKSICIAYETIQKPDNSLPLLTPMSEVAGRMAIQQGAKYLEMAQGGHGVLLGGVPGCGSRQRGRDWWRYRRRQCSQDGLRPWRQSLHPRHESGPFALPERRNAGQLL